MDRIKKFTSVFIASDFLATSQKEQDSNLRWLRDLFKRPLSTGGNIEVLTASKRWHDGFSFDRGAFFAASALDVDLDETQIFFEATNISDRSVEQVRAAFPLGSLIVGYELSAATRAVIHRAGLIYIDIWLHPVRFLDDLLFAFDLNDPEIRERIASFELPEELNYVYADRIRVQMYRGKPKINNDLKPKSALFIGQTLKDKAIASSRGMLTLLDFRQAFEKAASSHNHLYYSRHPFVKSGDEKSLSFARGFRNVSLTEHSTYMMLGSDEIKSVLSISSSVVTEAKYFGKKIQYLFRPPVRVYASDGYSSLLHSYLFSGFWRFVFSGGGRPDIREISFIDGRNKLRDMLSWYWGYRQIDRLESLHNNVSALMAKR